MITTPEVPSILVGLGAFGAEVVDRLLRERSKDDPAALPSIVVRQGLDAQSIAERVMKAARELLSHRRMVVARDRPEAEGLTRLHVFVIAHLGEREVSEALGASLSALERRLLGELGPIFESFRTGAERNLLVLPLCAMPHPAAWERGEELVRTVRSLSRRIAATPPRERAVPQLFLIEDVAAFSVLGASELEQCMRNFLSLLLYSLSAVERVTTLLYGDTPEEPLATFICAVSELPREKLETYARDRVALEVIDAVLDRKREELDLRDIDALEEVDLATFDEPRDAERDVLELLERYAPPIHRDPEPTWSARGEELRERYGPDPGDPSLRAAQPAAEPPVGWALVRMREIESAWRLLQRRRFDDLIAGERERIARDRDRTLSAMSARIDEALFADPSPEAFARGSLLVERMDRAVSLRLEDAIRARDAALPAPPPRFESFRDAHARFLDAARQKPDLGRMVLWGLLAVALTALFAPIVLWTLADVLAIEVSDWKSRWLRERAWLTASFTAAVGAGTYLFFHYRAAHLEVRRAFHAMYDALENTVFATRNSVLEYFASRLRLAREVARVEALLGVRAAILKDRERLTLVDRAARRARSRLIGTLRQAGIERRQDGRLDPSRLFGRGDEALVESLLPPESERFLERLLPPEARDARVRDVLFTLARDLGYRHRWREEVPFTSIEALRRAAWPHAEEAAQWDPFEMPESAEATAEQLAAFARRQARSLHVALNVAEIRDPTGVEAALDGVVIVPPRAYEMVRRSLSEESAGGRARIPVHRGVDPDRAFYVLSRGDIADDAINSLSLPALPPFEIEREPEAT